MFCKVVGTVFVAFVTLPASASETSGESGESASGLSKEMPAASSDTSGESTSGLSKEMPVASSDPGASSESKPSDPAASSESETGLKAKTRGSESLSGLELTKTKEMSKCIADVDAKYYPFSEGYDVAKEKAYYEDTYCTEYLETTLCLKDDCAKHKVAMQKSFDQFKAAAKAQAEYSIPACTVTCQSNEPASESTTAGDETSHAMATSCVFPVLAFAGVVGQLV